MCTHRAGFVKVNIFAAKVLSKNSSRRAGTLIWRQWIIIKSGKDLACNEDLAFIWSILVLVPKDKKIRNKAGVQQTLDKQKDSIAQKDLLRNDIKYLLVYPHLVDIFLEWAKQKHE